MWTTTSSTYTKVTTNEVFSCILSCCTLFEIFFSMFLINLYRKGNGLVVKHVAFDLRLWGLIPAIFLRSNCWVRLPHSLPSRTVLPGVQEIVGCPPTRSLCRLPRRSEFPLTLRLRQSPFAKGGWGLTYANKTWEAQVLLAGSTMKYLPWKRGVRMGCKGY